MLWFKAISPNAPEVQDIITSFGMEGYGQFLAVCFFCQQNGYTELDERIILNAIPSCNIRTARKVSPMFRQCFTNVSPNIHQTFTKHSPKFDQSFAKLTPSNPHGSTRDQEENRLEKNRIDNHSVEDASASGPTHPIWGDGLKLLTQAGMSEQNARSFLGRAVKQHGEGALNEAISATLLAEPANPKTYLAACLKRNAETVLAKTKAERDDEAYWASFERQNAEWGESA